jgi:hypothetical protein
VLEEKNDGRDGDLGAELANDVRVEAAEDGESVWEKSKKRKERGEGMKERTKERKRKGRK